MANNRKEAEMSGKKQTIDTLLGALTPEEKAGQLMVLGLNGTLSDPETELLIDKYCISGLRTSPYIRKFVRYLPDGAPGLQNVLRPPKLTEKLWEETFPAPYLRASEYAELLNRLRQRAMERKHGIPLHMAMDYESGEGSNYVPPGLLTLPSSMGMARNRDLDLIRRAYAAVGRQLEAIGIDHVHSPVVDVNTNPLNPEVSTRSFDPDPQVVTDCARAALQGVDADVRVELAADHLLAGALQCSVDGVVPRAQLAVRARAGQLHRAVGVDQPRRHVAAGDREVLLRPKRVDAVQGVRRDRAAAQQIVFRPALAHTRCL